MGFVYQATVTNNKNELEKLNYGLCETTFKKRYHKHTNSFRQEKNRNELELFV